MVVSNVTCKCTEFTELIVQNYGPGNAEVMYFGFSFPKVMKMRRSKYLVEVQPCLLYLILVVATLKFVDVEEKHTFNKNRKNPVYLYLTAVWSKVVEIMGHSFM